MGHQPAGHGSGCVRVATVQAAGRGFAVGSATTRSRPARLPEDFGWPTERMLQQIAAEQGRPVAMTPAFMRDVMARKGNARELRAFLEDAVVLSEAGTLGVTDTPSTRNAAAAPEGEFVPLHAMLEAAERRQIRSALERTGESVMKTSDVEATTSKTSRSSAPRRMADLATLWMYAQCAHTR